MPCAGRAVLGLWRRVLGCAADEESFGRGAHAREFRSSSAEADACEADHVHMCANGARHEPPPAVQAACTDRV